MKAMIKSYFILLVFSLVMNPAIAESITVSGQVSGNWLADTVLVAGALTIDAGAMLTIDPGVLVMFRGPHPVSVNGVIRALGEEDNMIRFTIDDTTGFHIDSLSMGGWGGIRFHGTSSSDSSLFDHCTFSFGKAVNEDSLLCNGGALNIIDFDRVRISNCLFTKNFASLNGGAVYLKNAAIIIRDCEFEGNSCGPGDYPWGYGGAVCADSADMLVFGCLFENNSSTGVGGAVAVRFHDATVNNSIFQYNYSALGGAIGYLHYYDYSRSQCNNLVVNNSSAFFGGGVANIDAGPMYVNNTIADNFSTYGGGFYCKDSLPPTLVNCILWGNTASGPGPQVYLWDALSSANFFNCDVEGGPSLFAGSGTVTIYEQCIDLDPQFAEGYYWFDFWSPCFDAGNPDTSGLHLPGTDLGGMPRIMEHTGIIDMGCYEAAWSGIGDEEQGNGDLHLVVFPNPSSAFRIRVVSDRCQPAYAFLSDLSGRIIRTFPSFMTSPGEAMLAWDGRDDSGTPVLKGLYILTVRQGNSEAHARMMKY